jgi:hypothetical protein
VAIDAWWASLANEPVHAFFRQERHRALKEVEEVLVSKVIPVGDGRELAYWAFPHGPHAGDPIVPRAQQYTDWLREGMWRGRSSGAAAQQAGERPEPEPHIRPERFAPGVSQRTGRQRGSWSAHRRAGTVGG